MREVVKKHIKDLTEEEKKNSAGCRFCPIGPGVYMVKDKGEVYYLCEKHKNYNPEGELP